MNVDKDLEQSAATIIAGLGGVENIESLDYCATRLRTIVKDNTKVSESTIKRAGVAGIIRPSQTAVQVVIGPKVQFVYDEVSRQVNSSSHA